MAHLLYMTFVDSQFKSHEMSLLFIVMCRVTYFWTPVFVSIYDRRLSILTIFDRLKCKKFHNEHESEADNTEEFIEEKKIFETKWSHASSFKYNIHE
jgi:hypothetical protein